MNIFGNYYDISALWLEREGNSCNETASWHRITSDKFVTAVGEVAAGHINRQVSQGRKGKLPGERQVKSIPVRKFA